MRNVSSNCLAVGFGAPARGCAVEVIGTVDCCCGTFDTTSVADGSPGGGDPFPPEVHHFKKAMSASERFRGSLLEMEARRREIGSLMLMS